VRGVSFEGNGDEKEEAVKKEERAKRLKAVASEIKSMRPHELKVVLFEVLNEPPKRVGTSVKGKPMPLKIKDRSKGAARAKLWLILHKDGVSCPHLDRNNRMSIAELKRVREWISDAINWLEGIHD